MRRALRRPRVALLLALLCACLLSACGPGAESPQAAAPGGTPPCGVGWDGAPRAVPVILVVSDTLRADRLGSAGGPARTPAFDAFARSALHFRDAHSPAPWTKPAVASLFTGLYPSQHRVTTHPELRGPDGAAGAGPARTDGLAAGVTTLAELFQQAGYATAGIVANPWLGEAYGFAQGFAHYDHSHAGNDTPGTRISEAALDWLGGRDRDRPFFLYLHYMDAHGPYVPVSEARFEAAEEHLRADEAQLDVKARRSIARFARDEAGRSLLLRGVPASPSLAALAYDGGVEQFDAALAGLLEGLPRVLGDTAAGDVALVVTSDHGEALFERGRGGHGHDLHREDTAIPLAMRLPGVAPASVDCPVSLLDVMATLVRYTGIPAAPDDHGRPLLLRDDEVGSGGFAVSEAVIGRPEMRALVTREARLIHHPGDGPAEAGATAPDAWSWFDRAADPEEARDRAADGEPAPAALVRRLEEAVPPWQGATAESVPMDDETRRRLEALGYLGADEEAR